MVTRQLQDQGKRASSCIILAPSLSLLGREIAVTVAFIRYDTRCVEAFLKKNCHCILPLSEGKSQALVLSSPFLKNASTLRMLVGLSLYLMHIIRCVLYIVPLIYYPPPPNNNDNNNNNDNDNLTFPLFHGIWNRRSPVPVHLVQYACCTVHLLPFEEELFSPFLFSDTGGLL